jgi:hypothetical protein
MRIASKRVTGTLYVVPGGGLRELVIRAGPTVLRSHRPAAALKAKVFGTNRSPCRVPMPQVEKEAKATV